MSPQDWFTKRYAAGKTATAFVVVFAILTAVCAYTALTASVLPDAYPGGTADRVILTGEAGETGETGEEAPAQAPGNAPAPGSTAAVVRHATHPPVFAYYYLWMQGAYWRVHKLDHPVRPFPGNYDSANPAVMAWQIKKARAAGLTGFIVSWRDNVTYRRLIPELEQAADRAGFRLAMDYEGLDRAGRPVSGARVGADFRYFATHYAANPAWYRPGGKPLTMWSDAQRFPLRTVAAVTRSVRSRLLVLNTAASVGAYERLARYTDGDAYYWSSACPRTDQGWQQTLTALSAAVHRRHQLWVAPFGPGFNATAIGGHLVVLRDRGATLRAEYASALASAPDLLGLISWNEWTENTYVEPSVRYGYTYLNILRALLHPHRAGAPAPVSG